MARLVYLKEYIKNTYQKYASILDHIMKALICFIVLCTVHMMFPYNPSVNKVIYFLGVSVVQAFLPLSFMYYAASVLILLNLWKVSFDILLGFAFLLLICYLGFIRLDGKYAVIMIVTPVLFFLKLEYILPVLLALIMGLGSIFPAVGGILIYFMSLYVGDASALLTTSVDSDMGIGLQRVLSLLMMDKSLLVIVVTVVLIIFITTMLYDLFHERAWLFSILIGDLAMAFLLLAGRWIFELEYSIPRVFFEMVLSILIAFVFQFFRGIGDVSRMEKLTFEDDEYIYYVKAVPKIKVTISDRNVTDIKATLDSEFSYLDFEDEKEEKREPEKDGEDVPENNSIQTEKRLGDELSSAPTTNSQES